MKKFPRRLKSILFLLAALAFIAKFSMDWVNGWSNQHAWLIVEEGGFEPVSSNSFKHAFTAAYGYARLRGIGLEEDTSRRIMETLGYANEMFEYIIWRPSKRDPAQEVYKDLWNNLAGIGAAENLISGGQTTGIAALRFALTVQGQHGGLKLSPLDSDIPVFPPSDEWRVLQAIKAYQSVREAATKQQRDLYQFYPQV